jgi:hypothetical protein
MRLRGKHSRKCFEYGRRGGVILKKGHQMKKLILSVVAAVAIATPALAADPQRLPPPPAPPNPWDRLRRRCQRTAFSAASLQSNHKPSAAVTSSRGINITPYLQLYAGVAGRASRSRNRAARIDGTTSVSADLRSVGLRFRRLVYWYPVGPAQRRHRSDRFGPTASRTASCRSMATSQAGPELLGGLQCHVTYRTTRSPSAARVFYSPSVLNWRQGHPAVSGNAAFTARARPCLRAGDCTCPAKPATGSPAPATLLRRGRLPQRHFPRATPPERRCRHHQERVHASDSYYDTDMNKGDCNAFTSDQHGALHAVTRSIPVGSA